MDSVSTPAPARMAIRPPVVLLPQVAAATLAARAVNALIAEAVLTPKPALVDQRGSGAHRDMDLPCLVRSASALRPTFFRLAMAAAGRRPSQALREELAFIGRRGEADMFEATGGVNAHRGAIWVIGLLIAAQAMTRTGAQASLIAETAGRIASFTDRFATQSETHGTRVCARYGVPGARGEAARGFPHLVHCGLPALLAARSRGIEERHARLDCLLAIMSRLEDTCLLHRGGKPALWAAQCGARRALRAGGSSTAAGLESLLVLDKNLLEFGASPGGCADLLAACLLLEPASIDGESQTPWNC
jgi:triphosphoribosyl-dephospho-CoA synthase